MIIYTYNTVHTIYVYGMRDAHLHVVHVHVHFVPVVENALVLLQYFAIMQWPKYTGFKLKSHT